MNIRCLKQNFFKINIVKDISVQSCLWDLDSYLKHSFKKSDLLPVKKTIVVANREHIQITGGIFMELMAKKYIWPM